MYTIFMLVALFMFVGIIYPTSWHKKIKIDTRWKNVGAFVLACIIAGIFAPPTPPTKTVTADKQTTATQNKTSAGYKIGDNVNVSNRSFKVNSVKEVDYVIDPTGTKYPAGDGARYIEINLTVTNQRKEQDTISSDEVKLVLKNGTEYSTDESNEVWVNSSGQSFFLDSLNPGVSKTANILFSVPKNVPLSALKLKVTDGGLVDDVVKYIELK